MSAQGRARKSELTKLHYIQARHHALPFIAKPEMLYLDAVAFMSTRSSVSGDLEQN
jgi:hypothetical protein